MDQTQDMINSMTKVLSICEPENLENTLSFLKYYDPTGIA